MGDYDNEYYAKNREARIKRSNGIQKEKGYPCDKTPERRKKQIIRKQTRRKHPLEGNVCSIYGCNEKAKYRHHITEPIEVDMFKFLCKKHHDETHGKRSFVLVGEGER